MTEIFMLAQQYRNEDHHDLFLAAIASFVWVNLVLTIYFNFFTGDPDPISVKCFYFVPNFIGAFVVNLFLPIGKY